MNTEYSVEEVREEADGCGLLTRKRLMLRAYADLLERLKADEGAVPDGWAKPEEIESYRRAAAKPRGTNGGGFGVFVSNKPGGIYTLPVYFTRPPAQAAQAGVTDEVVERATVAYARTASKHIPVSAVSMRAALLAVWPNPPAQAAQVPDGATEVIRRSLGSDGHAVSLAFRSQESADRFYTHMDEAMKVAQNTAAEPVAQFVEVYWNLHLSGEVSVVRLPFSEFPKWVLESDTFRNFRSPAAIDAPDSKR